MTIYAIKLNETEYYDGDPSRWGIPASDKTYRAAFFSQFVWADGIAKVLQDRWPGAHVVQAPGVVEMQPEPEPVMEDMVQMINAWIPEEYRGATIAKAVSGMCEAYTAADKEIARLQEENAEIKDTAERYSREIQAALSAMPPRFVQPADSVPHSLQKMIQAHHDETKACKAENAKLKHLVESEAGMFRETEQRACRAMDAIQAENAKLNTDLDWFRKALKASESSHQETRAAHESEIIAARNELPSDTRCYALAAAIRTLKYRNGKEIARVTAELNQRIDDSLRASDEIPGEITRISDSLADFIRRLANTVRDAKQDRDGYRDERNEIRRQLEAVTAERDALKSQLAAKPDTAESSHLPPWAKWFRDGNGWNLEDTRSKGNIDDRLIAWVSCRGNWFTYQCGESESVDWGSDNSIEDAKLAAQAAVDWTAWAKANASETSEPTPAPRARRGDSAGAGGDGG